MLSSELARAHTPLPHLPWPPPHSTTVTNTARCCTQCSQWLQSRVLGTHLLTLGILLEFNQDLGDLQDTGHDVTDQGRPCSAVRTPQAGGAQACRQAALSAQGKEHFWSSQGDFVALSPSAGSFHHHREPQARD